jgi:hypothetical protein
MLTEKQRSSLSSKLGAVLGAEDAELLVSQFDEPVTRDFIRAEIAELDGRISGKLADLDGKLSGKIAELDGKISEVNTKLEQQLRTMLCWLVGAVLGSVGAVSAIVALAD